MNIGGHEISNISYFANGFVGCFDENYDVIWLEGIGGVHDEYVHDFDVNDIGDVCAVGSTSSVDLIRCSDTDTTIHLNGDPLQCGFLSSYDSAGNCKVQSNLQSSDGSTYLQAVEYFSDRSLVVAGGFSAEEEVILDDVELEVPLDFQSSFVFQLDENLVAEKGLLLVGSEGKKRINDMLVDYEDNIWLSGYCYADTLIVGMDTLFKPVEYAYLPFLCKLDKQLNVIKLIKLSREIRRFYEGGDGNVYVRTYTPSGKHLIAIMSEDTISSTTPILEEDLMLELKPNLYRQGESIILDDKLLEDVRHMELFNVSGVNFNHCIIKHMSINTSDMPKGHYYIKFLMRDGRPALMRFVLF